MGRGKASIVPAIRGDYGPSDSAPSVRVVETARSVRIEGPESHVKRPRLAGTMERRMSITRIVRRTSITRIVRPARLPDDYPVRLR
jgi:hypothetical protein